MDDPGSAAHGTLDKGLVGVFLALDAEVRVQGDGAQPVVGVVVSAGGLGVDMDAGNIGKEFLVEWKFLRKVTPLFLWESDPRFLSKVPPAA